MRQAIQWHAHHLQKYSITFLDVNDKNKFQCRAGRVDFFFDLSSSLITLPFLHICWRNENKTSLI
jgi:hypothetical protein